MVAVGLRADDRQLELFKMGACFVLHVLQQETSLMCHHLYMSLYSLVSTGELDVYLLRPVYLLTLATVLH